MGEREKQCQDLETALDTAQFQCQDYEEAQLQLLNENRDLNAHASDLEQQIVDLDDTRAQLVT